MLVYF
jgi:predicted RNase H-like nuclease (RuvC/YqgF family)